MRTDIAVWLLVVIVVAGVIMISCAAPSAPATSPCYGDNCPTSVPTQRGLADKLFAGDASEYTKVWYTAGPGYVGKIVDGNVVCYVNTNDIWCMTR